MSGMSDVAAYCRRICTDSHATERRPSHRRRSTDCMRGALLSRFLIDDTE